MADFSKVERYLKGHFGDELGIPCGGVLVRRAHAVVFGSFYGFADAEKKILSSADTSYFLYSCSKPITTAAAMRLVEEGALQLDAPVSDYLPEFGDVFLMQNGERIKPRHPMTVRHLFTMSAGLDYNLEQAPVKALLEKKGGHASTREIVAAFAQSPLGFEPGERYQYSLCHDVLAAVIEAVTHEKFSDYLRRIIFEPLGMDSTAVYHKGTRPELAAQYEADGETKKLREVPRENVFAFSPEYESGGAGLISCAKDYSLFADAMANGGCGENGACILRPETIDLMRTEQLSHILSVQNFPAASGIGYSYALGVRTLIDRSNGQRNALGSFGWDGAAGSYMLADPTNKVSITYVMHVCNWPALIGNHEELCGLVYEALGL